MTSGIDKQKLADVFFQLSRACQDLGTILLREEKQQVQEPSTPSLVSPAPTSPSSSTTKKEGPTAVIAPKKEKDPNAPKKPLSAYMIYYQENYARLAKENSTNAKGVIEIGKLISEIWKTVDHSVYEDKAKGAKENYAVQMAKYNKTKSEELNPSQPALTEKRDAEVSSVSTEKPKKRAKPEVKSVQKVVEVETKPIDPPKDATTEEQAKESKKKEKKHSSESQNLEKVPSSPIVTDSQSTVMSVIDQTTGEKRKEKKKHHHHHKHNHENKPPLVSN